MKVNRLLKNETKTSQWGEMSLLRSCEMGNNAWFNICRNKATRDFALSWYDHCDIRESNYI